MLILFDVDATLITSGGIGIRAMGDAGRRLHGPGFSSEGVDFAGRLDPLIIADLLAANGVEVTPESFDAFRAAYRDALTARFDGGDLARTCPGVDGLLSALEERADRLTLGLLTGNFEETGTIKMQRAGLDPQRFSIRVWGDESPHRPPARDHLPCVAMERVRASWGRPARGEEVVVIGDTPHDIACARANGCRALGVATGVYSVEQLAGADRALADLSDVEGVLAWLMS